LLAVGIKLIHLEMGMRVYEHRTRTSGVGPQTSDIECLQIRIP
jgi:hypothetical protein